MPLPTTVKAAPHGTSGLNIVLEVTIRSTLCSSSTPHRIRVPCIVPSHSTWTEAPRGLRWVLFPISTLIYPAGWPRALSLKGRLTVSIGIVAFNMATLIFRSFGTGLVPRVVVGKLGGIITLPIGWSEVGITPSDSMLEVTCEFPQIVHFSRWSLPPGPQRTYQEPSFICLTTGSASSGELRLAIMLPISTK